MNRRVWMKVAAVVTAVAAAVGVAGTASAVVIFDADDEATWDWSVGKGDVQSALGWNAKQTDARFNDVVFTYVKTTETVTGCVDTATGRYNEVVGSKTDTDSTTRNNIVDDKRNKTQVVTGAYVTKTGAPITSGSDGECDAGFARNSLRETSKTETLSVSWQGTGPVVIWTLQS
jgi:hypothetical protein